MDHDLLRHGTAYFNSTVIYTWEVALCQFVTHFDTQIQCITTIQHFKSHYCSFSPLPKLLGCQLNGYLPRVSSSAKHAKREREREGRDRVCSGKNNQIQELLHRLAWKG